MMCTCDWCGGQAEGVFCERCAAKTSIAVLYAPHVAPRNDDWAAWLRLLAERAANNRPLFDDLSERPIPPARGDYTRCRKAFRPARQGRAGASTGASRGRQPPE